MTQRPHRATSPAPLHARIAEEVSCLLSEYPVGASAEGIESVRRRLMTLFTFGPITPTDLLVLDELQQRADRLRRCTRH